jgi:hypothetical protein
LKQIQDNLPDCSIYSVILDKISLLKQVNSPIKNRLYDQLTFNLLEKISLDKYEKVNLIVDRCKNNQGIKAFNNHLQTNFNLRLNLKTKLYITHDDSINHKGIQAADMFCYGIARKYECNDLSWYNLYKKRIKVEYLLGKKKTVPAMCIS